MQATLLSEENNHFVNPHKIVGNSLKKIRTNRGMHQGQFADLMNKHLIELGAIGLPRSFGGSNSAICLIESGKRAMSGIELLIAAEILEVPASSFWTGKCEYRKFSIFRSNGKSDNFINPHKIIGGNLRKVRTDWNMNQARLASLMNDRLTELGAICLVESFGKSNGAVSRIESGDRVMSGIELLLAAEILKVPASAFWTGKYDYRKFSVLGEK